LLVTVAACSTNEGDLRARREISQAAQYGYVEDISYGNERMSSIVGRAEIRVLLVSGARVSLTQESPLDFRTGDRVRVEQGRAYKE
jgi:hypothetical protein